MKFVIVAIVLLIIFFVSCLNWKGSIKAVLILLVFEGVLRKWILPEANYLIYFIKDIVLIGAYIRYYFFSPNEKKFIAKNDTLKFLIYLIGGWCIFQAFNPGLGSPLVGAMGIRGYLLNIPLIWMIPNLFITKEELIIFLRRYLVITIPVCLLGIVQFFSPISSPINTYAGGDIPVSKIAAYGGFVRISGTFPYLDPYVVYLIVSFALLIPLIQFGKSKSWSFILTIALGLIMSNSFMTGSRSCVFALVIFILGYLFTSIFFGDFISSQLAKKLFVPLTILSFAVSILFQPAVDNFSSRTESTGGVTGLIPRIEHTITDAFTMNTHKGFDGYGTGATQNASKAIRRVFKLPYGEWISVGYEEEAERIMLELGIFGFFFWYLLRAAILINIWRIFRKIENPFLKNLALSIFLIQLLHFTDQLVTHNTFSIYYWFLTGFIFLLPKLDKQEEFTSTNLNYNLIL